MHEGAGKAKEDFLHAEIFAAELSAMEQSRHGQVGIGYVPEIMIIGVAGFVSNRCCRLCIHPDDLHTGQW
jgi:hypothetical protein